MAQRKLKPDEIVRLRRILEDGGSKVFGVISNVGSSSRVRLFLATDRGKIDEITGWLRYAGIRFDKEERVIVQGHGFSVIQHAVELLEILIGDINLSYERL